MKKLNILRELFTQFVHDIYDITDEYAEKKEVKSNTKINDILDDDKLDK